MMFMKLWGLGEPLRWRHNRRDSVSNHQPHHCLLNCLFRRRSKETSKLRVTGLCVGNSPGTGEFPAQMASNAENVSIWWRHHGSAALNRRLCTTVWLFHIVNSCAGWHLYATGTCYNIVNYIWYCILHGNCKGRTRIRYWNSNRHPITHPWFLWIQGQSYMILLQQIEFKTETSYGYTSCVSYGVSAISLLNKIGRIVIEYRVLLLILSEPDNLGGLTVSDLIVHPMMLCVWQETEVGIHLDWRLEPKWIPSMKLSMSLHSFHNSLIHLYSIIEL